MTAREIVAMTLIVIIFILTLVVYGSFYKKEVDKKDKILDMAITAMLLAIITIMAFVPNMGYIQVIPGLSLTLVHIPVLLGAYLGGVKRGLLLGLYFGITSWIVAVMDPVGFNALFVNPLSGIPARIIFGLLAGMVFGLLRKLNKGSKNRIYLPLSCFGLTICHTALVFLDLFILHPNEIIALFSSKEVALSALGWTSLAVIGVGMVLEALLAAFLVPLIGKAINKANSRK